jgi:transglutaminase-like putative cysteine protease
MDFAAWIEVYLDGTWYTFDPRNNSARKGRVLIGRGRDALDVAMVTTYGGPVLERMEVWAHEEADDAAAGSLATAGEPAERMVVEEPGAAP